MKIVSSFLVCLLFFTSLAYSLDTTGIEALRLSSQNSTNQLSDSDVSLISEFWAGAMDELLLAKDSVEMVNVRRQLEGVKGEENLSYFSTAYAKQAKQSIETAIQNSQRLDDSRQSELVQRNLMILVGNLKSLKLVPIALEHLNSEDDVIRYWAFKAITQPAIIDQLSSDLTPDETLLTTILEAYKKHLETESQTEIVKMAVNFCMAFDNSVAREILLMLKTNRFNAYLNWSIDSPSADARLMTALGNIAMMQQDAQVKSDFGRAFSELFALLMQRYIMALEGNPDSSMDQLENIIAIVDQSVLEKTMGIRTGVLEAMRGKSVPNMKREYEALFGDRLRSGQLGTLLNFNYGTDDSGKPMTSPPQLPPKPVKGSEK